MERLQWSNSLPSSLQQQSREEHGAGLRLRHRQSRQSARLQQPCKQCGHQRACQLACMQGDAVWLATMPAALRAFKTHIQSCLFALFKPQIWPRRMTRAILYWRWAPHTNSASANLSFFATHDWVMVTWKPLTPKNWRVPLPQVAPAPRNPNRRLLAPLPNTSAMRAHTADSATKFTTVSHRKNAARTSTCMKSTPQKARMKVIILNHRTVTPQNLMCIQGIDACMVPTASTQRTAPPGPRQ